MKRLIIITAPSIDTEVNVSGIATVTGYITNIKDPEYTFEVFTVGKPDRQKRTLKWFIQQIKLPVSFAILLAKKRPSIIHINSPLNVLAIFRDTLIAMIAKAFQKAIIMHIHGGRFISTPPSRSGIISLLIKIQMKLSTKIITLGNRESIFIREHYGANSDKINVVPNAVTIPQKISAHDKTNDLNVLSIGRISYEKGIETICDLFECDGTLRTFINLRMYGTGPLYEKATKRLQISLGHRFQSLGIADAHEKSAAFEWADVILMPSIYGEGLPMALLEAMASGVVPITTNDGMILDVVAHNQNGFIVPKKCPIQVANTLSIARELKIAGNLESYSQAARKSVECKYNSDDYEDKIIEIYKSVNMRTLSRD